MVVVTACFMEDNQNVQQFVTETRPTCLEHTLSSSSFHTLFILLLSALNSFAQVLTAGVVCFLTTDTLLCLCDATSVWQPV